MDPGSMELAPCGGASRFWVGNRRIWWRHQRPRYSNIPYHFKMIVLLKDIFLKKEKETWWACKVIGSEMLLTWPPMGIESLKEGGKKAMYFMIGSTWTTWPRKHWLGSLLLMWNFMSGGPWGVAVDIDLPPAFERLDNNSVTLLCPLLYVSVNGAL